MLLGSPICKTLQYDLANMNPADMEALRRELGAQANALKLHNDQLTSITGGLQEMSTRHDRGLKALQEQLQSLTLSSQRTTPASTTSAAVHPSPVSGARLPHPERYSGNTPRTRYSGNTPRTSSSIPDSVFPRLRSPAIRLSHREVTGGIYHLAPHRQSKRMGHR